MGAQVYALVLATGQGCRGCPPYWTLLHDVTLKTLEAHEIKRCVIYDSRTGEKRSSNSNAFADDMNFTALDTSQKFSIDQVCLAPWSMRETANNCIHALGGSFNLRKCNWCCSRPIMVRGKPDVEKIHHDLEIVPTQGSPAEIFPCLLRGTPYCQLGVQVVLSLSSAPQIALLCQKCCKHAKSSCAATLLPYQSRVVFERYIAPAIQFPCTTQAISSKEIDALQNITLSPLLSKLGIANTFARHALYAPYRCGGANLKRWLLEVLGKQTALFISNFDDDWWLAFFYWASKNFTQLEWGQSTHFLASSNALVSQVCTPTWVTSLQTNYPHHDIHLMGRWVPPL
mmetsp:Transcript_2052/g.3261  ORF Transcript_2052/g.3261 Transcript_2052/m.3261 type:complete len:342 (-) Transcript_2052:2567-3592(-)